MNQEIKDYVARLVIEPMPLELFGNDLYFNGKLWISNCGFSSTESAIQHFIDEEIKGKVYEQFGVEWVRPKEPTEQEILQANNVLTQAKILAKQNEHDKVLASIVLQLAKGAIPSV